MALHAGATTAPLASIASLSSTSSTSSSGKSNASLPEILPSNVAESKRKIEEELPAASKCLLGLRTSWAEGGRRSSFGVSRSDPSLYTSFKSEATEVSNKEREAKAEKEVEVEVEAYHLVTPPPPPASASRRRSRATWRLRLQAPGLALQAQILRERTLNLTSLVDKLHVLTDELADEETKSLSRRKSFQDIAGKILEAGDDIFDGLIICLRESLSSRKLSRLRQLRNRSDPVTLDISVRYFGLDWAGTAELIAELTASVNKLCESTVWKNGGAAAASARTAAPSPRLLLAPIASAGKRRRRSSNADVLDTAVEATQALNKIREDLISHSEALLAGRLNHRHNDRIW